MNSKPSHWYSHAKLGMQCFSGSFSPNKLQTAHCIAQGKVGSGFDVSSAVFGSQRYVRFSPEVLSSAQVFLVFPICLINSEEVMIEEMMLPFSKEKKRDGSDDLL